MQIAINAVSAKRGGAVTYLRNVLPELRRQLGGSGNHHIVVWRGAASTAGEPWPEGVEYREDTAATGGEGAKGGSLRRLWFDQVTLPSRLRTDGVDALFSSANFAPLRSVCRQVLLVRNPIYFDHTFMSRVKAPKVRAYYRFQRWLTLRSMAASDVVLFPTQGMLDMVMTHMRSARPNCYVAHYGTRHDLFHPARERERDDKKPVRLLHVSFYSDQKNLGTLLKALSFLDEQEAGRYRLRLNAGFEQEWLGRSPYFPHFRAEQALYTELKARGVAEDGDWQAYGTLPDVYRDADLFVFPSYTESFGHPLVEAMASGLPIVAADAPVNRELCGDGAVYFPPFDVMACAEAIRQVSADAALRKQLSARAQERAPEFSWDRHVSILLRALRGELQ
jgi:glycosyltransferase involved in cell wall biosynthesis